MKLSVIIPVYNTAPYLKRCIDSVLAQPWSDKELIVVNDGSTDNSLTLLKEWYGSHAQVRIYDKPNGGLSDARNEGMIRASGELITFVDSDDYLARNTYSTTMEHCFIEDDSLDMMVFRYRMIDHDGHVLKTPFIGKPGIYSNLAYLQQLILAKNYSSCNKIFRRKILCGLTYPVGKKIEDLNLLSEVMPRLRRVRITAEGTYEYLQNAQSITKNVSKHTINDLYDAADKMMVTIRMSGLGSYYLRFFLANVVITACRFLVLRPAEDCVDRSVHYLKMISWYFFYTPELGWKKRLVFLTLKIFGIKNSIRIFKRLFYNQVYKAMFS